MNSRGDVWVAQGMPERTELVRLGKSYVVKCAAIACVTAVPTTTASAYVWNGNPTGGRHYIIDRISWVCTTSAGAASMFSLVCTVSNVAVTQPATTDTLVTSSLNGEAVVSAAGMGHTATITDYIWRPIGPTFHSGALTATVGVALDVTLQGEILVPPGGLLGLACIAANTTAVGVFAVTVHELDLVSGRRI